MEKKNALLQPAIYLVFILYFIAGYLTLSLGDRVASMMFSEDHYFENVGAISLFAASALTLIAFVRAWRTRAETRMTLIKQLSFLGLALLFFFGAGEEISWGQRIFNIETPAALEQANDQEELNIHNLAVFERIKFFTADHIFDIFWSIFAVAIPAASLMMERFQRVAVRYLPIAYWGIGALFVTNYLLAKLAKLVFASAYTYGIIPYAQAVQEVKESNYELLFAFLALYLLWDLNRSEPWAERA